MSARAAQRPTLTVSFQGTTVIGMLLSRGKAGVEAFDVDEESIGVYPTSSEAHAALIERAQA